MMMAEKNIPRTLHDVFVMFPRAFVSDLRQVNGGRWFLYYIAPMALLALAAVMTVIYAFASLNRPAEFFHVISEHDPSATYCPGDVIPYRLHITVESVPSILLVVETFWNVDERRTLYSDHPRWIILSERSEFERDEKRLIPDLPPGHYEFRRGAQDMRTSASVTSIEFIVPDDC